MGDKIGSICIQPSTFDSDQSRWKPSFYALNSSAPGGCRNFNRSLLMSPATSRSTGPDTTSRCRSSRAQSVNRATCHLAGNDPQRFYTQLCKPADADKFGCRARPTAAWKIQISPAD